MSGSADHSALLDRLDGELADLGARLSRVRDDLGALRPAAAPPGGGVPTTGVPGRAPAPPAPPAPAPPPGGPLPAGLGPWSPWAPPPGPPSRPAPAVGPGSPWAPQSSGSPGRPSGPGRPRRAWRGVGAARRSGAIVGYRSPPAAPHGGPAPRGHRRRRDAARRRAAAGARGLARLVRARRRGSCSARSSGSASSGRASRSQPAVRAAGRRTAPDAAAADPGPVTLAATGITALYLTVAAATSLYDLLPAPVALVLALLVAGGGLALADRWRRHGLALGVVIGAGLLLPLVVDRAGRPAHGAVRGARRRDAPGRGAARLVLPGRRRGGRRELRRARVHRGLVVTAAGGTGWPAA